jgi:hypothetical protein
VVSSRPAQATVPPVPAAPSQVTTAAPVPAPAAAAGKSSAQDFDRNVKKGDVDSILDQVPQGLRKKFGF